MVSTLAERGSPVSRAISPKLFPGPSSEKVISVPLSSLRKTLTFPVWITQKLSPGSPRLKSRVFAGITLSSTTWAISPSISTGISRKAAVSESRLVFSSKSVMALHPRSPHELGSYNLP